MRKKIFLTAALAFALTGSLFGSAVSASVAAWSTVDWNSVDSEIEAVSQGRSMDGNIDVMVGENMNVPASTLRKLAGGGATLALQAGDGMAISATGSELETVERDLKITVTDEEDLIPVDVRKQVLGNVLYSRMFAMEEKDVYDIKLNVHFSLGREYAGKYANLYHFDEQSGRMLYDATFVITGGGMAMFSLGQGDEYILTVTEGLPAGGRCAYTVAAGDYLIKIASKNGTSLNALLAANPGIVDADKIYVGQVIAIVK